MMNFADLPVDQSYGNVPSVNSTITDILLGAYKNSLNQKDMQKQKSMQDAMQYAQPFGNEQDLAQQQMKILQDYRVPDDQMQQPKPIDSTLTGDIGNAVAIENMAKLYGENDSRVIAARKAQKDAEDYQQSLLNYRNGLSSSGGNINSGGKPGSVSLDANGNPIAIPTIGESTKLQQSVIGMNNVLPYFDTIVKDMSQFQTAPQKLILGAQKLSNEYLGTNYKGPSVEAEGLASISSAAEGLVRSFGLNATNQNLNRMVEIMTPHKGESPDGYKERAAKQAADFINIQRRSQSAHQGIPLSDNQSLTQQNSGNSGNLDILSAPDDHIVTLKNGQQMTVAEYKKYKGIQ